MSDSSLSKTIIVLLFFFLLLGLAAGGYSGYTLAKKEVTDQCNEWRLEQDANKSIGIAGYLPGGDGRIGSYDERDFSDT